jgi:methylated-DNA-[protein]-cysteine S-methyltransferase
VTAAPPLRSLLLALPGAPLLRAAYDDGALRKVEFWPQGKHPPAGTRSAPDPRDALGRRIEAELREYFAGGRRTFQVPVAPEGTPFQQRVWAALCAIPYGETRSYAQLAEAVGSPRAFQAVGQANRRNPIPIVIPCHRVLSSSGGIGGYLGEPEGGPGTALKEWLLGLEGGPGHAAMDRPVPERTG